MSIFDVLTMILGLALFLYGMNTMGEALTKTAGSKLQKTLEHLTSNRVKSVALGSVITAVIQSSSATTVMVVGFVNSGIIQLSQAVDIIMGANIGTTATSWLLSLTGINGTSFFVRMLKPSSFIPVLAAIGIYLILFTKKEKKKNIGNICLGFSILMVGMTTMSDAVTPLASVPTFTGILTAFSNPVLGLIVGAIFTAIIQSSSASIGILQALCLSNPITNATVLPIIMGQNIGTCVTTILSSIGANKNAKRAAMIHLYFNIIGTAIFMTVFYVLHNIIYFEFLNLKATVFSIAMMHSIFNVTATIILLPFTKLLENLATATIPDKINDTELSTLVDKRLLATPMFAVKQCIKVAHDMAHLSVKAFYMSVALLTNYTDEKYEEITKLETIVDKYEDELGTYLVKLSQKDLTKYDSQSVSIMLFCLTYFERISDHATQVAESAKEMHEKGISFSNTAIEELKVYLKCVKDVVNMTEKVFCEENLILAQKVEPLEEVVDNLTLEIKTRHINRLKDGKCTIELGFILSDLTTSLERISDHCSNIAACIIEVRVDSYDTHRYINRLKNESGEIFKKKVIAQQHQYKLPELEQ